MAKFTENIQNNIVMCVILVIIIVLCLYFMFFNQNSESFVNSKTNDINNVNVYEPDNYPNAVDTAILDDYPLIGKNKLSDLNASQIWKYYPVLPLGSYKQITNNLRYYKNPDDGKCTAPDFCGALYHDAPHPDNEVKPLPPAEEGSGARVNYYRTTPNELIFSIPTNENILY